MAAQDSGGRGLSRKDTSISQMLSTVRPTFTSHRPRDRAKTSTSNKGKAPGRDIPPLDKIPTKEFIERFLQEDVIHRSEQGTPSLSTPARTLSSTAYLSTRGSTQRKSVTGSDEDQDDLETVLDIKERRPLYDVTGQLAYDNACRKYGALPSSNVRRKLRHGNSVEMPYYGTGPRGAKAIAIPMVVNTNVTSLNLKGNDLNLEGVSFICKMMAENSYITELNLSENRLRSQGAEVIARMLSSNQTLQHLELAGNCFQDSDAALLAKPIEVHPSLRYLNLNNNEFGSKAGTLFKDMIAENTILREMDLSWNHIRVRGACDLCQGVKDNVGLKILNLAWNGFGLDGAVAMSGAFSTCTLNELDLSSNRINDAGFLSLIKALKDNDDLKILKLGRNSITEQGGLAALDLMFKQEHLALQRLDLADVILGPKFASCLVEFHAQHPNLEVVYGYTDSYGQRRLRKYNVVEEALTAMRAYCLEHNINLVELFARFDEDGSMSVTHEEFKQGLKEAGIPLTPVQVKELIKALDEDGDGEIDFGEMVMGTEKYDSQSEPPKSMNPMEVSQEKKILSKAEFSHLEHSDLHTANRMSKLRVSETLGHRPEKT